MGYGEASQRGIKANGREWQATIRGIPDIMERLRIAREAQDVAGIDAELRNIAAKFRPHMDRIGMSFSGMEDIEWFEEESCAYEVEQGILHEWVQEFDYRMGALYDFADYNRIWVDPTPTAQE